MTFDLDAWEERSAILEFDAGMTRFRAEMLAAQAQGVERHDAIRIRNSQGGGDIRPSTPQRDGANNMSRMQRGSKALQSAGPVSECHVQAGRGGLALPSLRA